MNKWIGLDLGTSSIKGILTDDSLRCAASASVTVDLVHSAGGRVEIDPEEYFRKIYRLICDLALHALPGHVSGIAMAAASGNTLLLNGDLSCRSNIISWLDSRSEKMPPEELDIYNTVGWPPLTGFPLGHLTWIKDDQPEMLHDALVGMSNDFITARLTGERKLDYSSATPFYMMDQRTLAYHRPILNYLGIKEEQLPGLVPSGTFIGKLRNKYFAPGLTADTAIHAGSFDHPAAARALGVTAPGTLLISAGTSFVGFYASEKRELGAKCLADPFQSPAGGCWGNMFSVPAVGQEIEKMVREIYNGDYELFNNAALEGESPARSLIIGMITKLKSAVGGRKFRRLMLAGGPSKGKAVPHFLQEIMKIPVEISPYGTYTGAAGAALLAKKGQD